MKKITAIILCIIMLVSLIPTTAYAQDINKKLEPATYSDAMDAINEMIEGLTSMISEENEADVTNVLSGCGMQLLEVQMGFMNVADDGSDRDLFTATKPSVFEFIVEPAKVDQFDYIAGYNVYRDKNYICIDSEAFDEKTEEQFDYLRFEFAQREKTGEKMLLITICNLNGCLTSTSRYLLYHDGTSTQLLHSRTLGKTLEYRIDVTEWANGTNYTWGKELLYPAVV